MWMERGDEITCCIVWYIWSFESSCIAIGGHGGRIMSLHLTTLDSCTVSMILIRHGKHSLEVLAFRSCLLCSSD